MKTIKPRLIGRTYSDKANEIMTCVADDERIQRIQAVVENDYTVLQIAGFGKGRAPEDVGRVTSDIVESTIKELQFEESDFRCTCGNANKKRWVDKPFCWKCIRFAPVGL